MRKIHKYKKPQTILCPSCAFLWQKMVLNIVVWIFVAGQIAFAESFPGRPTPKQLEAIVTLPSAVIERCLATQYSIAPALYRVYPPFGGGVRLDPDTLELIAITIKELLPWYVDTDTFKNGSANLAMLTVAGVWADLQIGDSVSKFTATAAACDPNVVYGDRPARVSGLPLNERAKVLNKLKATALSADIFQRKHGSDYTGISVWGEAISAAERSYEANGGGMGPVGTWSSYSVATWSTTRERPWLHYRPTVVRVVKGGVTLSFLDDILSKLASLAVFMSATKYEGTEIGVQNFEFDDNGLGGLSAGWVWNEVRSFSGPFQSGQQLLFIDSPEPPARCVDPQNKTPPGAMKGYVTASPEGVERVPFGMANWRFSSLPTDLPVISVLKVELTIRASGTISAQTQNDKHDAMTALIGSDTLGAGLPLPTGFARNTMEIVGQISPLAVASSHTWDFKRDIDSIKMLFTQDDRAIPGKQPQGIDPTSNLNKSFAGGPPAANDDSVDSDEDLTPTADGKIYVVDSPGMALGAASLTGAPVGSIAAYRFNAKEWVRIDGTIDCFLMEWTSSVTIRKKVDGSWERVGLNEIRGGTVTKQFLRDEAIAAMDE